MKVEFSRVGKDKKFWSADVASLSDASLIKEIRKMGALMSRGIDLLWNEDGTAGVIVVCGCRPVGAFRVEGGARLSLC